MASFRPLNVIFDDDESEEEVDDSKELQIEEALKLYQNALKLHSQGPEHFKEAEEAYKELFRSEIFTYPESLSEQKWLEQYGDTEAAQDVEEDVATATIPAIGSEATPSTMPQILYLANKNYGQFRLDQLRHRLYNLEQDLKSTDLHCSERDENASLAHSGLQYLAEAVSRDESDLELWRRISRLGEFLGSYRLARFCLESVLDDEEISTYSEIDQLGLEERFASERLQSLVERLESIAAGSTGSEPKQPKRKNGKTLSTSLAMFVDPCPFLPEIEQIRIIDRLQLVKTKDVKISAKDRSWITIGKAILLQLQDEQQGDTDTVPGSVYRLDLPKVSQPSHLSNASLQSPPILPDSNKAKRANIDASDGESLPKDVRVDNTHVPSGLPSSSSKPEEDQVESLSNGPPSAGLLVTGDQSVSVDAETSAAEACDTHVEAETLDNNGRKRSSDEADLPDNGDPIRSRSKRIKARGSMNEGAVAKGESAEESAKWFAKQTEVYVQADDLAFQFVDSILTKFQIRKIGCCADIETSTSAVKDKMDNSTADENGIRTLKRILKRLDLPKSRAFVKGGGLQDPIKGPQMHGLSAFLERSSHESPKILQDQDMLNDDVMEDYVVKCEETKFELLEELGLKWLLILLSKANVHGESLYRSHRWPDNLKDIVVHVLVQMDPFMWSRLSENDADAPQEVVQSIFELHLDVYGRITNPSSKVDEDTRKAQRDRLCRWMNLAGKLAHSTGPEQESLTDLHLRYLWAITVCNSLLEPTSTNNTAYYYQELTQLFQQKAESDKVDAYAIVLTNNALMPEMSASAAEREISRMTTMDFFKSIFSSDEEDPYTVVYKLEPLLELSLQPLGEPPIEQDDQQARGDTEESDQAVQLANSTLLEAKRFLDRSNISLKLFLWYKLRDAYGVINYPSMIMSCNFRCIGLLVDHLSSPTYCDAASDKDLDTFLQWIHKLDELLTPVLAFITTDSNAFECIDDDHLRTLMSRLVSLLRTLHVFAMWEDSIRIGKLAAPFQPGSAGASLQTKAAEKFRDMIVKTWTLLYLVIQEGTKQNTELLPSSEEDLLTFLRLVHQILGLRSYCGVANKIFLKLARSEMLKLKPLEGWDLDMPQVIYDLYGLKISSIPSHTQDHGCDSIEIDKQTAYEVLSAVMIQVNRLTMRDLLKNDIRFAVDKLQQVIKVPKASENASARTFNKRLVNNYLKSPINPLDLFRSFKGVGGLAGTAARSDGWRVAERGWYFLLGDIALAKFRSQKRTNATSTEELENAKVFLKYDLEYDVEKWETWYRLAQIFDTLLEEQTLWASDKIERDQASLVELQRQSVLCYSQALALANGADNVTVEDAGKMADMYKDYGVRLYASSREPFSMGAFALQDFERPYNKDMQGMYRKNPFQPLSSYQAWKLSSRLLRMASSQKPNDWFTFYMLAKVRWKMCSQPRATIEGKKEVGPEDVIDAITSAIDSLPDKKDSRHTDKDPILEPHYKLLSILHKMVQKKLITASDASRTMQATSYAQRVDTIEREEEWIDYMQEVLRRMRSADKSNWHHRLVARAARTTFDADPTDIKAWLSAKHVLTQQMFTKTMTVQVWKPEHERPGRHFVYTSRYVRFLLKILLNLSDKESVENLAKRIRKKGGDFFDHVGVWSDLCKVYLAILRDRIRTLVHFDIPQGFDDVVFKSMNFEEFQANAARIENWIHNPQTKCDEVEVLREAIEFRKLNNKLLKDSIIEETVADIYTTIYAAHADRLKQEVTQEENRVRMRVDNILFNPTPPPTAENDNNPSTDQAATKRRFNVITHREVIRRAEALMTKQPPIATPKAATKVLPSHLLDQGKSPAIAVVIPPHSPALRDGISVPVSPSSVHDSADDESELSDVEDQAMDYQAMQEELQSQPDDDNKHQIKSRPPMFPNLMNAQTGSATYGDDKVIIEDEPRADGVGKQTEGEMDAYAAQLQEEGGVEAAELREEPSSLLEEDQQPAETSVEKPEDGNVKANDDADAGDTGIPASVPRDNEDTQMGGMGSAGQ